MNPSIRPATPADWPAIAALLESSHLPLAGAREHLEHFLVAMDGERCLGVTGLEPYGRAALLRSVATAAHARGQGIAAALVKRTIGLARQQGIETLVLLTTTAEDYFPRHGFLRVERQDTPASLWQSAEFTGACPASATVMRLELGHVRRSV